MPDTTPSSFSNAQRILHWAIAILIGTQFLTGQFFDPLHAIEPAGGALPEGGPPLPILVHVGVGVSILVLAVTRLLVRIVKGAPASPPEEPHIFRLAAAGGHIALYALMFLMPITGLIAFFGHAQVAGWLHGGPLKLLLLALIAVHFCAVLVHQFIWKTNVLARMTWGSRVG